MKHRSTLLLLAAVVLAAVVAWELSKEPTSGELARTARLVAPGLRPAEVTELAIDTDGERIVCRRADRQWWITSPRRLRADRAAVEKIIRTFAEARQQSRPVRASDTEKFDPADYGLHQPRHRVSFRTPERHRTISVGAESGIGDLVYVSTQQKGVVRTLQREVVQALEVNLTDLRSKRLTPSIQFSQLTAVSISGPEVEGDQPRKIVCRKRDGVWEMGRPVHDLADRGALMEIVKTINTHRLDQDDFVSEDPGQAEDYGLAPADATLVFDLEETRHAISLGRRAAEEKPRFYARNTAEPPIVKIPEKVYRKLTAPLADGPNSLRTRSLAEFSEAQVRGLTVTRTGNELTLRKEKDRWVIAGEPPAPADEKAVTQIVRGLRETEVRKFLADAPDQPPAYGLQPRQRWEVRLTAPDGHLLAEVHVGQPHESGTLTCVRRPGYPAVLGVSSADWLSDLKLGRPALLERTVLEMPPERVVRVEIRRGRDGFVIQRTDPDAPWRLTAPVSGPADPLAVQGLLDELNPLRAQAVIAETADNPSAYGLEEPSIRLRIEYRRQSEKSDEARAPEAREPRTISRTLLVGARREMAPAGHYAAADAGARVFVLPDECVQKFHAQPASKTIARADGVTGMTFAAGGRSVGFIFDARTRDWRPRGGGRMSPALREKLKTAAALLEDFRADRVAAYVVRDAVAYGFDSPALTLTFRNLRAGGKKIMVGKELENGARYVRGPATGYVHVASSENVEKLLAVLRAADEMEEDRQSPEE